MDDIKTASRFKIRTIAIAGHVHRLSWNACGGGCVTHDANSLWLRVKLSCADFNLAFGGGMCPWIVSEVNRGRLKAENVTHEWTDMNLWMRLDNLDLILEVNWTVTLNLKLLGVRLANQASFAHINELGE